MAKAAKTFRAFTEECKGSSRLYERLSAAVAGDPEMLALASHARPGQPVPNLLFAAAHYLLLQGKDRCGLAGFYRTLTDQPGEPGEAYPFFRRFCLENAGEILPLLQTKLVQTNEVRRCAYLYPAFCWAYARFGKPLALLELGTSAGLQLLWDEYGYDYGGGAVYGKAGSAMLLKSDIRGKRPNCLLINPPPVKARIGVDLHVNDLRDPEDRLWLSALIWPEHTERLEHLKRGASLLNEHPVDLREGHAMRLLPELAAGMPDDAVLCVFHTHVANQFSAGDKAELREHLRMIGKRRSLVHLYNNMEDGRLHLDYYLDGKEYRNIMAETDGHGRWFHWLLEEE
ncbi:DUF2332 domain-containing protein [Paenibacillus aurantius]|uniref:DUF2332 domain-containing protein n=2 Tax=Paenibacillus aurantius TaxID=2918900 RepID=A0AA96RIE1_9BACL|nr:DUF2332 domain-containing protein [Paenibacillus aurantius]WNQ14323.1 DUF2332 domain-containing protein [Paenibacillus aurantius]